MFHLFVLSQGPPLRIWSLLEREVGRTTYPPHRAPAEVPLGIEDQRTHPAKTISGSSHLP